jgi:hypothetical protein
VVSHYAALGKLRLGKPNDPQDYHRLTPLAAVLDAARLLDEERGDE